MTIISAVKTIDNPFRKTAAYQVFLEELNEQLSEIRSLLDSENAEVQTLKSLKESFHRFKGSAGMFGHDSLGDLARELENMVVRPQLVLEELKEKVKSYEALVLDTLERR